MVVDREWLWNEEQWLYREIEKEWLWDEEEEKAIWHCRGFTLTKLKRHRFKKNERKKKELKQCRLLISGFDPEFNSG